ncbi:MAG: hypothetical protein ABSF22_23975 [Bryobacteraceae bacterium]
MAAGFTAGCGSSGSMSSPSTPKLARNTSVTVVLTSTAKDQWSEFDLGFQSIALTSQSGKAVNLLSLRASVSPWGAEFVYINGTAEPLLAASLSHSHDVYTSATINLGGGEMVCVALVLWMGNRP